MFYAYFQLSKLQNLMTKNPNVTLAAFSSGMTNPEVIRSLDRSYRMPRPDGCPEELYDIMMMCWRQKPDDRPTFEFLQNILNDFFIATEGQYEMQP